MIIKYKEIELHNLEEIDDILVKVKAKIESALSRTDQKNHYLVPHVVDLHADGYIGKFC